MDETIYRNAHDDETDVWIEKSDASRPGRRDGSRRLGSALWSPQNKKNGHNSVYYENLKRTKVGDLVIHLDQNQREIVGYSRVSETFDETTVSEDTKWDRVGVEEMNYDSGERPAYIVRLDGFTEFDNHVDVDSFLSTKNREVLSSVRSSHSGLVYNKNLQLNQGAYLTKAPPELVGLIDTACFQATGAHLPVIDEQAKVEQYEIRYSSKKDLDDGLDISISPVENLHYPGGIRDLISQIESSINSGKHVVFTGPPGTGKTEIAKAVAEQLTKDDKVSGYEVSTATADWSTFETVGGYMPETDDSGELEFRPGQILRRFSGQDGSQKNECLVIDEINRADIDKAFGQFFTVLSGQKVTLPFETAKDEEIQIVPGAELEEHEDLDRNDENVYVVPESWRLLATMNTYDKTSLYELSYAFMRRFAFIRVGVPELEHDRDKEKKEFMEEYLDEDVWDVDLSHDTPIHLYNIWESTNHGGRDIGPAIVKDMAEFLEQKDNLESSDYVQAVSSFVLPQLEGVQNKGEVVSSISGRLEDGGDLKDIARDMFDRIDFEEDG